MRLGQAPCSVLLRSRNFNDLCKKVMGTFAERWPRWPADAAGKEVLAVQVGCSVDTLFEAAFADESEFTVSHMLMLAYGTDLLCCIRGTLRSRHVGSFANISRPLLPSLRTQPQR